jgi:hypothetical protein
LGALTLSDVDTVNGAITASSAGALTVTDVASGTNGNIVLSTSSGDITGLATVNAGSGNVTLNSAGAIVDDGSSGTVITGGVLTADAAGAITIDSTVTSANISTSAAGAVDLDETDAITLTDVDTNDGSITVDAGGLITGHRCGGIGWIRRQCNFEHHNRRSGSHLGNWSRRGIDYSKCWGYNHWIGNRNRWHLGSNRDSWINK